MEEEYQDKILEYTKGMSEADRFKISNASALNFLPDEKDPRGGRIIRDCVTDQGVSPAWSVFKVNEAFWHNNMFNMTHYQHCAEQLVKPGARGLLVERVGECPLQWISPERRARFYHVCLKKYNINAFRQKARSATYRLERIAFAQKAETEGKSIINISGGTAQIVGGVLAGIGIVLAPVTAGASLTLKLVGGGIALAGSVASLFQPRILEEHKSELEKLKTDAETLSTLLLLFTQSSSKLSSFQVDEEVNRIAHRITRDISERQIQNIGSTVLNSFGAARYALDFGRNKGSLGFFRYVEKLGNSRLVALAAELQNSQATASTASQASSGIQFLPLTLQEGMFYKALKTQSLTDQWKHVTWKGTRLGAKIRILSGAVGKALGQVTSFLTMSALNVGLGIYNILNGVKKMETGFHHHIISAAREIVHETDMIVGVYRDLIGLKDGDQDNSPKELYTVDLKVTMPSRGYLTFVSGNNSGGCTTPTRSFPSGWTKLSLSELGDDCKFYKIYDNKLHVAITSQSRSKVQIDSVQVATAGNHLPSLHWINGMPQHWKIQNRIYFCSFHT